MQTHTHIHMPLFSQYQSFFFFIQNDIPFLFSLYPRRVLQVTKHLQFFSNLSYLTINTFLLYFVQDRRLSCAIWTSTNDPTQPVYYNTRKEK